LTMANTMTMNTNVASNRVIKKPGIANSPTSPDDGPIRPVL
jgi:hypothetical protein